jgi:acyl-CoA synthetase (NDP forming)
MRAEVKSAIVVVADEARRFRRSHEAWLAAVAFRERVAERADLRIAQATGGLTVDQWKSLCERGRINTTADSRAVARAVRAEATVRQAIAGGDCQRSEADAAVRRAGAEVASVAQQLLRYGALGRRLLGVTRDELARPRRSNDPKSSPPRR